MDTEHTVDNVVALHPSVCTKEEEYIDGVGYVTQFITDGYLDDPESTEPALTIRNEFRRAIRFEHYRSGFLRDPNDYSPAIQVYDSDGELPIAQIHYREGRKSDPDSGAAAEQYFDRYGRVIISHHYVDGMLQDPDDGSPARIERVYKYDDYGYDPEEIFSETRFHYTNDELTNSINGDPAISFRENGVCIGYTYLDNGRPFNPDPHTPARYTLYTRDDGIVIKRFEYYGSNGLTDLASYGAAITEWYDNGRVANVEHYFSGERHADKQRPAVVTRRPDGTTSSLEYWHHGKRFDCDSGYAKVEYGATAREVIASYTAAELEELDS